MCYCTVRCIPTITTTQIRTIEMIKRPAFLYWKKYTEKRVNESVNRKNKTWKPQVIAIVIFEVIPKRVSFTFERCCLYLYLYSNLNLHVCLYVLVISTFCPNRYGRRHLVTVCLCTAREIRQQMIHSEWSNCCCRCRYHCYCWCLLLLLPIAARNVVHIVQTNMFSLIYLFIIIRRFYAIFGRFHLLTHNTTQRKTTQHYTPTSAQTYVVETHNLWNRS